MATPSNRHLRIVVSGLDIGPLVCLQVQSPEVVQLIVVVILPTEDVHGILKDGCRVAASGDWDLLAAGDLDVAPFVVLEGVLD